MSKIVWSEGTTKKMKDWAEQADVELTEVEKRMTDAFNEVNTDYPEQNQEFYEQRARFAVNATFISPILRSRSKPVMIYNLGRSSVRDIWANDKRAALEAYAKSAEHAVNTFLVQVKTDENGVDQPIPLGTKEFWSNGQKSPYFRKPLPYTPQMTVINVGYPLFPKHQEQVLAADQSLIKLVHIKVGKLYKDKETGEIVLNNPENWKPDIFEPAKVYLNLRQPTKDTLLGEGMYLYNDAGKLRYKVVAGKEFSETMDEEGRFKDPNFAFDIMKNLPSMFHAELDEIAEWIDNHADDYDTPIVVEGWVSNVQHYPDEGMSYSIELQDMDENKLQCWVHDGIYSMMSKIGRRTHVMAIGYPTKKEDEVTGEVRLNLNSWGVAIDHQEFYSRDEDPVEMELVKQKKDAEKEAVEAETAKE